MVILVVGRCPKLGLENMGLNTVKCVISISILQLVLRYIAKECMVNGLYLKMTFHGKHDYCLSVDIDVKYAKILNGWDRQFQLKLTTLMVTLRTLIRTTFVLFVQIVMRKLRHTGEEILAK